MNEIIYYYCHWCEDVTEQTIVDRYGDDGIETECYLCKGPLYLHQDNQGNVSG